MNRDVKTGQLVLDQFPALEDDGYTKRSGLVVPTDLAITVYKDGVIDAMVVTITEIGTTGDYKISFTPITDGFYVVQVLIDFSKEIWAGYYNASGDFATIQQQVDKIDKSPTLVLSAVTTGSLMDRVCNSGLSKTYNQATDSLEAIRDNVSDVRVYESEPDLR